MQLFRALEVGVGLATVEAGVFSIGNSEDSLNPSAVQYTCFQNPQNSKQILIPIHQYFPSTSA
jgi:hypothetical protein